MESCFKIGFNILDYVDVIPEPPENIEEIINWDKPPEECYWERQPEPEVLTPEYKERELTRILRTGVWIYIKDHLVWIPPNYYFFLQHFPVAGEPAQFRLKRLKHVYFKIRVRRNLNAIGTYTIKNRQDGETTFAMAEILWEIAKGNMTYGSIGIQSKTRDTVVNSCWRVLIAGYKGMSTWVKDALFSDIVSDDKLATTIKFQSDPDANNPKGRNIVVTYGASTHNAFDSMNNMRRCVLDETNKWEECSFYATFLNYKQFVAPGTSRRGIFDIFSSPADKQGRHNDEALEFWRGSNPDELNEYGTTATGVFRYYSNPLDGIEGMYDIYGDADPVLIKRKILADRASMPKDKVLGEIRAYPLSEEEMFGAHDGSAIWSNTEGILNRKTFLIGRRFKDEKTKEPIYIYGNLEREGGYIDGDVIFRASDKNEFDLVEARWCFAFLPDAKTKEPLRSIFKPPKYVEGVIGIDPFNNTKPAKNVTKQSMGAMVHRKFRDIHNTGIINVPTAIYCNRPHHIDIFFEDALKFAIFTRSLIQIEAKSDRFASYAEERGYADWLIDSMDGSGRKGDSPSGSGRFLNEAMGLLDANLSKPANEGAPYYLENYWLPQLLDDYLNFNPSNTQDFDLTMADMQAIMGCLKLTKKTRKPSKFNKEFLNMLFS